MKLKRVMGALISTIMLLTMAMPVQVAGASMVPEGTGTAEDPYLISTARQLTWFGNKANSATDKTQLNARLTADIVLNSGEISADTVSAGEWTPILDYNSTFDGDGHTISGLFIRDSSSYYIGLFGSTSSSATIKNLGIVNSYVEGALYAGSIVGRATGTTITNCYNGGTVVTKDTNSTTYAGGIVGYYYTSVDRTLSKLYNTGNIVASTSGGYAGGIVGRSSGYYNYKIRYYNTINQCYNLGNVTGKYSAGIAGYIYHTNIDHCYNYGKADSQVYDYKDSSYGTMSSNYGLSGAAAGTSDCTVKTAEEFASGEVAYLLNDKVTGGTTWYQNVDMGTADAYPLLDESHYRVYYNSGTDKYTNMRSSTEGFTDDNIWYNIDANNGVLELEGEGTMTDYNDTNRAPWYSSRYYISEVKIYGDLVVDINAFDGMTNLTTIYVDKGSLADDAGLYPEGVTLMYNDGTQPEPEPEPDVGILYGDVDGDGAITVTDAIHVLKKAADGTYLFPIEGGDATGDATIENTESTTEAVDATQATA